MRKKRHPKKQQPPKVQIKSNEQIRAEEVRLLGETGEFLGVMSTQKALELAQEQDVDLVEISPNANPPVAKLMPVGKYLYEQEKKRKKQKAAQKSVELKSLRLSFKISEHDKDVRFKQAVKFLNAGHKIKLDTMLRGRERQHAKLGIQKMQDFINDLQSIEDLNIVVEQPVKMMGNQISAIVMNKTDNK